jgi:hypothetical protein
MSVVDLSLEKKKRVDDNGAVTPEELLRMALEDLQKGDYPHATRCLIMIVEENPDPNKPAHLHHYRCRMGRVEEIGYLDMWKDARIRRYHNG